ncbi:MAG: hypothetical protein JXR96_25680 [Deltaproteobacteria bacterium]|nr:hypothetical protein [Deltaproteobacteria bacterium]
MTEAGRFRVLMQLEQQMTQGRERIEARLARSLAREPDDLVSVRFEASPRSRRVRIWQRVWAMAGALPEAARLAVLERIHAEGLVRRADLESHLAGLAQQLRAVRLARSRVA